MNESRKLPAFQFYPGDWLRDPNLRACSLEARGIWIEMLCIMHQAEPYGHLTINGVGIDLRTLSRLVGADFKATSRCLTELASRGVFSKNSDGVIYSRRMVKDEALRRIRRQVGALGGNPKLLNLVNQKDNQTPNQTVNTPANQKPTPSSSSSSSASKTKSRSSKSGVKHQTAREGGDDTALLSQDLKKREDDSLEPTAPPTGPPEPLAEFQKWVSFHVPNWAQGKARKVWKQPEDQGVLAELIRRRALYELQAGWMIFIRPGSKDYDFASGQRFSMREFKRQLDHLVDDSDYSRLKRRYMSEDWNLRAVGSSP